MADSLYSFAPMLQLFELLPVNDTMAVAGAKRQMYSIRLL